MAAMITHVLVAMPTLLVTTAARFVAFVNIAGENASVKENSCTKSAMNNVTQQKRALPRAAEIQDEGDGDLLIGNLIVRITTMQLLAPCGGALDLKVERWRLISFWRRGGRLIVAKVRTTMTKTQLVESMKVE